MFAGIRRLMAVPFARPPGGRSLLRRFAPEWWALGIYVAFAVTAFIFTGPRQTPSWGWQDGSGRAMHLALAVAYGLGGAVLFLGPLWSGAMAWARERQAGTLDALVLTPLNSTERARGRFWHVFAPWAKLLLYLLPLYLVLAGAEPFDDITRGGDWELWPVCIFVTKPLWAFVVVSERLHNTGWSVAGLVLVLLRFANDFTIVFFACAAAYYISARVRSTARALLGAGLVALGMLTVLSLHDWLLAAVRLAEVIRIHSETVMFLLYGVLGALAAAVRVWLGFRLVRRAARNFDAYALGERPERS